jgi:hypothetical protein
MSDEQNTNVPSIDMIRLTFTCDPKHRKAIEEYLTDLSLDVVVLDECKFVATWDEPDHEVEEIVEELWALNGVPFEVTQEDFHRLDLHTYYDAENEASEAAA